MAKTEPDETELTPIEELPVVARMVVEIRSDGVRTQATGAIEDTTTGQQVAIQTPALHPLQLSTALAKSLLTLPAIATRDVLRAVVPERVRKLKHRLFGRSDDRDQSTAV